MPAQRSHYNPAIVYPYLSRDRVSDIYPSVATTAPSLSESIFPPLF